MKSKKIIKFTPELTDLIKAGKKTTTWRLFDDKDLQVGDHLILATRDGEFITDFGEAIIKDLKKRTLKTIREEDYEGHEPVEDMVPHYRKYYGDKVGPDTEVKVIKFEVVKIYPRTAH